MDDGEVDTDGIVALALYSAFTPVALMAARCLSVLGLPYSLNVSAVARISASVGQWRRRESMRVRLPCRLRRQGLFHWGHGLVVFAGSFVQDDMAFFGVAGEDGLDLAFTGGEEGFLVSRR